MLNMKWKVGSPENRTFGNKSGTFLTDCIPFLSPKQQCQSTNDTQVKLFISVPAVFDPSIDFWGKEYSLPTRQLTNASTRRCFRPSFVWEMQTMQNPELQHLTQDYYLTGKAASGVTWKTRKRQWPLTLIVSICRLIRDLKCDIHHWLLH